MQKTMNDHVFEMFFNGEEVEFMFDEDGIETMDISEVVEVGLYNSILCPVDTGDILSFKIWEV